jgi:hypothetical protein
MLVFAVAQWIFRRQQSAIDIRELKTMLDGAMGSIISEDRLDIFQRLANRLLGPKIAEPLAADKASRDQIFALLSAGQRFIISVAADVVGFIEERSILLFDEPETHLHPGLLSTLIAILDEILREFQSFAVIAMHSPILLQQVPRRYVRVLRRRGSRTSIGLPNIETFETRPVPVVVRFRGGSCMTTSFPSFVFLRSNSTTSAPTFRAHFKLLMEFFGASRQSPR